MQPSTSVAQGETSCVDVRAPLVGELASPVDPRGPSEYKAGSPSHPHALGEVSSSSQGVHPVGYVAQVVYLSIAVVRLASLSSPLFLVYSLMSSIVLPIESSRLDFVPV